jgi:hypothetical protein
MGREPRNSQLSYKFQRLRERLRHAVASGELTGKLLGERELARRFHVNAKTLSKALTDLAAEGLLHRSVGRGTFVKGSEIENRAAGRWLLITDGSTNRSVVEHLRGLSGGVEICSDTASVRPSFLNQFSAVIDLAERTPDAFVRDLLIRSIPFISAACESRGYSTNAVVLDAALGAALLTRDLVLGGHRRFLVIEDQATTTIAGAIRTTASRYCNDFCVDICSASNLSLAIDSGATACICDSVRGAIQTLQNLNHAGVDIPQTMSVAAIGWADNDYPCTGYFADPADHAAAIAEILRNNQPSRPASLWLAGRLIDCGTTASIVPNISIMPSAPMLLAQ